MSVYKYGYKINREKTSRSPMIILLVVYQGKLQWDISKSLKK